MKMSDLINDSPDKSEIIIYNCFSVKTLHVSTALAEVIIHTCSLQMVKLFELLLCPDMYCWFEGLGDVMLCETYHKSTINQIIMACLFPLDYLTQKDGTFQRKFNRSFLIKEDHRINLS